jgi:4-amino-4-deoxy-L-arabinose transferase-like glycosyltransferase
MDRMADSKHSSVAPTAPVLHRALLLLGALQLLLMAGVVLARIGYPFELEWMEGAMVDHVQRVLRGQPLYVRPSVDFVSYNYPPLYYWASAGVAKLTGAGFLPLRLVSFASALACLALLFLIARRETGRAFAGFLAAALFAATFKAGGAWFDIARVDMMALALLLAAVYLLRHGKGWLAAAGAGTLLALASLTKQLMLAAALPLLAYVVAVRRPHAWLAPVVLAAISVPATWLLNAASGGWYAYYVFGLPRKLPWAWHTAADFWVRDVAGALGIGCALVVFHVLLEWRRGSRERPAFYGALLVGLVGISWAARLPVGGFNNVLIPAYAGLALAFGLAVPALLDWARALGREAGGPLLRFLYVACLLQLVVLLYDPVTLVPSPGSEQTGRRLLDHLRRVPGEVLVAYHGYLPELAGKTTHAHWMALGDVVRFDAAGQGGRLAAELEAALARRRFAVVVLDNSKWWADLVEKHYVERGRVFEPGEEFWPVTGMRTRPEYVYTARRDSTR